MHSSPPRPPSAHERTTLRPLRLPGQAAAPEGPVDMTIMYVMHHAFRRDLAAFAAAVPVTPVEDQECWRALAERWELFSTPLHHHHEGEDTWLWPWLMERVDEAERVTLAAMEAEHAEIDPGLEACAALFLTMAHRPDPDTRAALSVRLTAVKEGLARHLAHEETDTIALLQRVMTQPEWEEIDAHFKEGLTFAKLLKTVPWAVHGIPTAQREELFARTGSAHRVLWWLTRGRFERLERRAFRHLGC
jgi:iron-sulfur cluster repair protein YtfE (RIC family)